MKIALIFLVISSIGFQNKQQDLKHLICVDSIQFWNYEWKRKFPKEFGKFHCKLLIEIHILTKITKYSSLLL
jgi:hypothetical protein